MKEKYSVVGLGEIPYKMMLNKTLMSEILLNQNLSPIHAVLIPTNRCNLKCSFCNCANRNVFEEMDLDTAYHVIDAMTKLGIKVMTLSGGGEPLLHPDIIQIIQYIKSRGIEIGLVTNGTNIQILEELPENAIEWCRISFGDERDKVFDICEQALKLHAKNIINKVGFSYIYSKDKSHSTLNDVLKCLENEEIFYLKIMPNQYDDVVDLNGIEKHKKILIVNPDSHAFEGCCLMPLVKPIINVDGYVYPCCDKQYEDEAKSYKQENAICHYTKYERFVRENEGKIYSCSKCYHFYGNEYLRMTKEEILHADWI